MISKDISNELFFANIKCLIDSDNRIELKVKGTSMYPTLLDNRHKVVLIPYQRQKLRIGTLALYVYNNKHILHRLVGIKEDWLIFKGDSLVSREYIRKEDIIAIVEFIITPAGKVIDCKKQSFFIKNSLRLWLEHFSRKAKGYIKKLIKKN